MAGGWSRWILLRGKLHSLLSYPWFPKPFIWSFKHQCGMLMVLILISGANRIGRSSWYRKQRSLCWYTCLFTFSEVQDTKCSGWQRRAVCANNWKFYSFVITFVLYVMSWCIIIIDRCVICRVEFEEGESLIALPCKHSYHPECINQWLQINKVWWTFLSFTYLNG